jgi:hypothetical protein
MRSKRWVLCIVIGILMSGPLGGWGTPQEASPDQSGKGQTSEATKPFTVDELNARLDRAIGLGRMEVATMQKLVTWYEVNRDHPDAQQLQRELCGNRRVVREAEAQVNFDKTDFLAAQKSASPEDAQEIDDKVVEVTGLIRKTTTLLRQLAAMGCVCPAEAPEATTAPAEAAPKSVDPADPTATLPNLLRMLDLQKKGFLLQEEGLEQCKRLSQINQYDPMVKQCVCSYKPNDGSLTSTEREVKKFTGPDAPPLTADERLSLDVKWSEVQRLQSELRRDFESWREGWRHKRPIACPDR